MNEKTANSSDASTGQTMVARVLARKAELEQLLASAGENTRTQNDISTALNTVNAMLSGDLENVPHVVVADMNRWLENNKHLAESAPVANEVQPGAMNVLSIASGLPVVDSSSTDPWRPNS
jgi:hypothetical protein